MGGLTMNATTALLTMIVARNHPADNVYGTTILWPFACVEPTNHARTLRVVWTFHAMLVESACSEAAQCVRRQREWKVICEQIIGRVRSVRPDFV